ncbi:hypothetical protein [Fischerella thermalis]|uniref:hypothetical protein n=1 Tax=Fischerella thermalis TaxID=372787 RepID=UPI0011AF8611|nr:hypothetical protein [Fischerella thermalis]
MPPPPAQSVPALPGTYPTKSLPLRSPVADAPPHTAPTVLVNPSATNPVPAAAPHPHSALHTLPVAARPITLHRLVPTN